MQSEGLQCVADKLVPHLLRLVDFSLKCSLGLVIYLGEVLVSCAPSNQTPIISAMSDPPITSVKTLTIKTFPESGIQPIHVALRLTVYSSLESLPIENTTQHGRDFMGHDGDVDMAMALPFLGFLKLRESYTVIPSATRMTVSKRSHPICVASCLE